MPVTFDQDCLHLTFNHTKAVNPIHRNYEKLSTIVIRACLNITGFFNVAHKFGFVYLCYAETIN